MRHEDSFSRISFKKILEFFNKKKLLKMFEKKNAHIHKKSGFLKAYIDALAIVYNTCHFHCQFVVVVENVHQLRNAQLELILNY